MTIGKGGQGQPEHNGVDAGNPVKIGGKAFAETPAAVPANDRVDGYYTQEGRKTIVHDLLIAGENLVHNFLAVHTKPLAVEQDSWDRATVAGAASLVVKAAAGRVRQVMFSNDNAAVHYGMIFNATALPANGTAPIWEVEIPGDSVAYLFLPEIGDYMDTGIVAAVSSAIATLTLAGTAAEHNITALYK